MPAQADQNLHVYMLNVGQGDTTVIVSPKGRVMVMDAIQPNKLLDFLNNKLQLKDKTIEHLVISHPHTDHFSGANRLAKELKILQATVAPFWHKTGIGPATYRKLIGELANQKTNTTFLSGYSRWYPDGSTKQGSQGANPEIDEDAPFVELLGASTGMVRNLMDAKVFDPNHLSIMARISWRKSFRMIIAADAQMENWAAFDDARLLEDSCQVLRSAHHGSANGTQWERVNRLDPREVIVSSEPDGKDELPDITGSAIFAKFNTKPDRMVCLTHATGTIHLTVQPSGSRTYERYGEPKSAKINLGNATALKRNSNPTDWPNLLDKRVNDL